VEKVIQTNLNYTVLVYTELVCYYIHKILPKVL